MSVIAVQKTPNKITFAWDTQTKRYGQPYYDPHKVSKFGNGIIGFVGQTKIRPYLHEYLKKRASVDSFSLSTEYSVCSLFDDFRNNFLPDEFISFDDQDNVLISDSKKVYNIDPSTNECFEINEFEAVGSGGDLAWGAFKAGADIVQACEIACDLNLECGKPVKFLEVEL